MKPSLLLICLFLAACGSGPRSELRKEALDTVDNALNQNDGIAKALESEKPYHAAGIIDNGATIRKTLELNSKDKEYFEGLRKDYDAKVAALHLQWQNEKEAYENQLVVNQARLEAVEKEAKEKGFLVALLAGLGVAWTALRTLRTPIKIAASALNIPFAGKIVDFITGIGNLDDTKNNLKTLVKGSDVGIKEVGRIEGEIEKVYPDYSKQLKNVTGGKYTSLAQLAKDVAKAFAIDEGKHREAREELSRVRDEMKTNELRRVSE